LREKARDPATTFRTISLTLRKSDDMSSLVLAIDRSVAALGDVRRLACGGQAPELARLARWSSWRLLETRAALQDADRETERLFMA